MTNWELFKSLSYIDSKNLSGAEALQAAAPASHEKRWTHALLIAAAVTLSLLLVGCAVAYAAGWFQRVFSTRSGAPLSEDQIRYIENNEQPIAQTQSGHGWSIELKSTISDGIVGYLVFQITAPEDMELEQYLAPPTVEAKHLSPGNYSYGQRAAYSMAIASIGNVDQTINSEVPKINTLPRPTNRVRRGSVLLQAAARTAGCLSRYCSEPPAV